MKTTITTLLVVCAACVVDEPRRDDPTVADIDTSESGEQSIDPALDLDIDADINPLDTASPVPCTKTTSRCRSGVSIAGGQGPGAGMCTGGGMMVCADGACSTLNPPVIGGAQYSTAVCTAATNGDGHWGGTCSLGSWDSGGTGAGCNGLISYTSPASCTQPHGFPGSGTSCGY